MKFDMFISETLSFTIVKSQMFYMGGIDCHGVSLQENNPNNPNNPSEKSWALSSDDIGTMPIDSEIPIFVVLSANFNKTIFTEGKN